MNPSARNTNEPAVPLPGFDNAQLAPESAPSAVGQKLPTISIITPSFNQGQYLAETIRSVIEQNYPHYELIIIDGGSTDSTLDVIHQFEEHITYWVSEPDRGQSHAIRKGLEVATGDIINWINSDDLVAPGAFHRIAQEFDPQQHDVICGYCDFFLDDLQHLDLRNMRMGLGASVGDTMALQQINQPSTFFKASVLKELSINEQFRYTMDMDLWYRYLLLHGQTRVRLSEGLFTYFRLHEASKSVAEGAKFEGEVWKVNYNVLYTFRQDAVLLDFAAHFIPDFSRFVPVRYETRTLPAELRGFIRYVAWLGMHYYNLHWNQQAVRQCLKIARHHGQPLNKTMLRQLFKHFLLPTRAARWLAGRPAELPV